MEADDLVLTPEEYLGNKLMSHGEALRRAEKAKPVLIGTTIPSLDQALGGGLRVSEFTLLGGYTGSVKTRLATNVAARLAVAGVPVVYVNTEGGSGQMLDSVRLFDQSVMAMTGKSSEGLPMNWLHSRDLVGIENIVTVKRRQLKRPLALIVDWIQLLEANGIERISIADDNSKITVFYSETETASGTREREVANIADRLAKLAVSQRIIVIGVAQLNRGAHDQEPELDQLRESGMLEAMSGTVMLSWVRSNDTAWIKVAKCRRGQRDRKIGFKVTWATNHFQEMSQDEVKSAELDMKCDKVVALVMAKGEKGRIKTGEVSRSTKLTKEKLIALGEETGRWYVDEKSFEVVLK